PQPLFFFIFYILNRGSIKILIGTNTLYLTLCLEPFYSSSSILFIQRNSTKEMSSLKAHYRWNKSKVIL
ncbi:hypothetical protein ACJX0J_022493, partial [Zea mays]